MCCARYRRSESVYMTMPRIGLESDGRRGRHVAGSVRVAPGWIKVGRGYIQGVARLLPVRSCEPSLAFTRRLRDGFRPVGDDQGVFGGGDRIAVFRLRLGDAWN